MFYVFHHNDTDGRMSAAVIAEYLKEKGFYSGTDIEFFEIDYTVELREELAPYHVNDDDTVFFVDYSFSKDSNVDYLAELCRNEGHIIWIDHHKTSEAAYKAINELDQHGWDLEVTIDSKYCATVLCYMWAKKRLANNSITPNYDDCPNIIKYTDSYDCWKMNMNRTHQWHYGILEYGIRPGTFFKSIIRKNNYSIFFPDEYTTKKMDGFTNRCIKNGELIMSYVDKQNEQLNDTIGFDMFIDMRAKGAPYAYQVRVINQRGNSRMFGEDYYDSDYDMVMPFYFKDGKWVFSLFSGDGEIDCSKIASILGHDKKYGAGSGGGHMSSAGGVLKCMPFEPECHIVIYESKFKKKDKVYIEYIVEDDD